MGSVKAWKMEMDEHIADAIVNGAATENAVMSYVGTMMHHIDKAHIKRETQEIFGGREIKPSKFMSKDFWAYDVERIVSQYDMGEISKGDAIEELRNLGFANDEIGEILSITGVLDFAK